MDFKKPTMLQFIVALFIVSLGFSFVCMPRYTDDLWYAFELHDYLEGEQYGFPFTEIANTWKHHFLNDNARLSNIVFVPFLLLPKWVGSILATLLFGYAVFGMLKLCGVGTDSARNLFPVSVVLFLLAFAMPWYDSMGSENLQFNYLISMGLAVAALSAFFSGKKMFWPIAFLLGLLLGLWHEGFGVPLLCGIGVYAVVRRKIIKASQVALLIGLLGGCVCLMSCPVFFDRAYDREHIWTLGHLMFIAVSHIAVFVLVLSVVVAAAMKRLHILNQPVPVVLLVSIVVSLAIHVYATRTPRTGMWAEFASIFMSAYVIANLMPHRRKLVLSVAACILLALTAAHQWLMDIHSVRIGRQFSEAVERYATSADGTVFVDFTTEYDSPLLAWYSPDFTLFTSAPSRLMTGYYYRRDDCDVNEFKPVPTALEYISAESGRPVAGNSGIRINGSHLFMPCDSLNSGEFRATIDFGYKTVSDCRLIYIPFVSKKDGQRYAYLYPWRRIIEMRFGSIRRISI